MRETTIRPFAAEDAAWLTTQHQALYTAAEGFDDSFGPLVASIIAAFLADHDPQREAGWIAQEGDQRLGSIFCVRQSETRAKLRLFLLLPEARGTGLGQRMLETCLGFARGAGYADMQLWTHESHVAAGRLYAKNGFALTASKPVHSFGVDLVEQTWQIAF